MSEFRRTSYDSNSYDKFRPVYPDDLYSFIVRFREGREVCLAVDVAAGTGQIARALRDGKGGIAVRKVIAFDASDRMLQVAREAEARRIDKREKPDVEYRVGKAEDLGLPAASVDLVTVGQGTYWFDMQAFWKEAARVLKPLGTIAMFAVSVPTLPGNSEASQLLVQLAHGDDYLGPYWEQRSRTLSRELFLDDAYIPPSDLFSRWERHVQTGDKDESTVQDAPLLSKTMRLSQIAGYLKTWCAYHKWKREHADAQVDILDECITKMRACIETEHSEAETLASSMFLTQEQAFDPLLKVVWPLALILAERK